MSIRITNLQLVSCDENFFHQGIRPSDHQISSFFYYLTLVIGITDLVFEGVCHLPFDYFLIDLEHLFTAVKAIFLNP